jgi:SsrA-binding protein
MQKRSTYLIKSAIWLWNNRKFTAGIVLAGTEIKSIRLGKANTESFLWVQQQWVIAINTYIEEYTLEINSIIKHEAKENYSKQRELKA